jgi:hypothetical protein
MPSTCRDEIIRDFSGTAEKTNHKAAKTKYFTLQVAILKFVEEE